MLLEHSRAHNINIRLSGVHMTLPELRAALLAVDEHLFSTEQLQALAKASPKEEEKKDVQLFLAGKHPKAPGVSDPARLASAER